jgi:radical SAM-linked protein
VTQATPISTQPQSETTLCRVRITYARRDALRYVSHLDMQTVWERTLRRAGVPLAYSQGFNPRPRLHLASALPLGFLSRCEITDIWLEMPSGAPSPDPETLGPQVEASAPPGLDVLGVEIVPLNLPALQTQVKSAEYVAEPLAPTGNDALREAVRRLLAEPALPRERRGKPYDLRLLVETLEVRAQSSIGEGEEPTLFMRLAAREGATGRPEEVLAALGFDPVDWRVERTALILE